MHLCICAARVKPRTRTTPTSARHEVDGGILPASIDFEIEFDSVAFIQTRKARTLNSADMHKRIRLPIIPRDKTKTLHRVEEFHRAGGLFSSQFTLGSLTLLHRQHITNNLKIACRHLSAAVHKREFELLPFGQSFETRALNSADMDEHIFAAIFTLDKAEALVRIEEFDRAFAFANNLGRHSTAPASSAAAAKAATFGPVTSCRSAASEPVAITEPVLLAAVKWIEFFLSEPIPLVASPSATTSIKTHFFESTFASPRKRSPGYVDEAPRMSENAARQAAQPFSAKVAIHHSPYNGEQNCAQVLHLPQMCQTDALWADTRWPVTDVCGAMNRAYSARHCCKYQREYPVFRKLSDSVFASPQISVADIAEARKLGIALVINNRPDGESDDQTPGEEIEAAATGAGLAYCAIPIGQSGFSETQVEAMAQALEQAKGPVLAYCRSGTRSTLLWSLAQASRGGNPQKIAAQAADAGYDISPVRAMVDMLAAGSD